MSQSEGGEQQRPRRRGVGLGVSCFRAIFWPLAKRFSFYTLNINGDQKEKCFLCAMGFLPAVPLVTTGGNISPPSLVAVQFILDFLQHIHSQDTHTNTHRDSFDIYEIHFWKYLKIPQLSSEFHYKSENEIRRHILDQGIYACFRLIGEFIDLF